MKKKLIWDIAIAIILIIAYFTNQISIWILSGFGIFFLLKLLFYFVLDEEQSKEDFLEE